VVAKLSGDPALKAEAIHHVDSAFGSLLVVVVLFTNIVISSLQKYPGEQTQQAVIFFGFFVAFSILTGFAGILKQSFLLRLAGWFFVFGVLLVEVIMLGLIALLRSIDLVLATWHSNILILLGLNSSFLLTLFPVMDAYHRRLSAVSCQDDVLAKIRSIRRPMVFLLVVASCFILLSMVTSGLGLGAIG